uniref:ATP-dependent helicase Rep n=4 Tax=Viruses TaxID=10239 RepID=A0A894JP16_9VIRU|nr:replicase [Circular ssDNA virus sp.]
MSLTKRIQCKNFYLTYLDGEGKIIGPMWILDELVKKLEKFQPYYGIACKEEAPTTGTVHYHVLVCCAKQCRTRDSTIIEIQGINPHMERVTGGLKKIIEYIRKDGIIAEYNKDKCPVKMDQVTKEMKNRLMLNGDLEQEFMKGTLSSLDVIRAAKIRGIFEVYRPPEPFMKKLVLWFKGLPGEGKTRKAVQIAQEHGLTYWMSNSDLKWFDGYNSQEVAIIDDFRKSMLSDWNYLLRLLDGYGLLVQVKGAFKQWNPKIIVITTPATPSEAFQWINKNGETQEWDRQEQLERRMMYDDELQLYEFPLWKEEEERLERTINKFLGIAEQPIEEDFELSPILPEPSQIDEA